MPEQPAREYLATLWERMDDFCTERGWAIELFVREDKPLFGRVGARCIRATETVSYFGHTSNDAIRGLAMQLERDGFHA